ncbi:unnamed protein product [Amoebophrya sp. A120]|nr:unnamed protein product [Amoebophrya sp. A120]|eukprot:GSA120T00015265001.1
MWRNKRAENGARGQQRRLAVWRGGSTVLLRGCSRVLVWWFHATTHRDRGGDQFRLSGETSRNVLFPYAAASSQASTPGSAPPSSSHQLHRVSHQFIGFPSSSDEAAGTGEACGGGGPPGGYDDHEVDREMAGIEADIGSLSLSPGSQPRPKRQKTFLEALMSKGALSKGAFDAAQTGGFVPWGAGSTSTSASGTKGPPGAAANNRKPGVPSANSLTLHPMPPPRSGNNIGNNPSLPRTTAGAVEPACAASVQQRAPATKMGTASAPRPMCSTSSCDHSSGGNTGAHPHPQPPRRPQDNWESLWKVPGFQNLTPAEREAFHKVYIDRMPEEMGPCEGPAGPAPDTYESAPLRDEGCCLQFGTCSGTGSSSGSWEIQLTGMDGDNSSSSAALGLGTPPRIKRGRGASSESESLSRATPSPHNQDIISHRSGSQSVADTPSTTAASQSTPSLQTPHLVGPHCRGSRSSYGLPTPSPRDQLERTYAARHFGPHGLGLAGIPFPKSESCVCPPSLSGASTQASSPCLTDEQQGWLKPDSRLTLNTFRVFIDEGRKRFASSARTDSDEVSVKYMRDDLNSRQHTFWREPKLDFDLVKMVRRMVVLINVRLSLPIWQSVRNTVQLMKEFRMHASEHVSAVLALGSWYFVKLQEKAPKDTPTPPHTIDPEEKIPVDEELWVMDQRAAIYGWEDEYRRYDQDHNPTGSKPPLNRKKNASGQPVMPRPASYNNYDAWMRENKGKFAADDAEIGKIFTILLRIATLVIFDEPGHFKWWFDYVFRWIPSQYKEKKDMYPVYPKKHLMEVQRWALKTLDYRLLNHEQFWMRYLLLSGKDPAQTERGPLSPSGYDCARKIVEQQQAGAVGTRAPSSRGTTLRNSHPGSSTARQHSPANSTANITTSASGDEGLPEGLPLQEDPSTNQTMHRTDDRRHKEIAAALRSTLPLAANGSALPLAANQSSPEMSSIMDCEDQHEQDPPLPNRMHQ